MCGRAWIDWLWWEHYKIQLITAPDDHIHKYIYARIYEWMNMFGDIWSSGHVKPEFMKNGNNKILWIIATKHDAWRLHHNEYIWNSSKLLMNWYAAGRCTTDSLYIILQYIIRKWLCYHYLSCWFTMVLASAISTFAFKQVHILRVIRVRG